MSPISSAMALATALWIIAIVHFATRPSAALTDPNEVAVLKTLLRSWRADLNWTGNDPCGLKWQGVSCSNGSVVGLDLNGKGIRGSLPGTIGTLKHLRTLSLQKNLLSGSIPAEIGNLTSLTALKLSVNSFSGALPSTINRLWNLQDLSVHHNNLNGRLPALSNLTGLTNMYLQVNHFEGSIPPELATFKDLRTLQLSSNQFSGPIPSTISQLSYLSTLYLDHNSLTGPFPNITGLKSLQYLWVQYNELTGPIPWDIGDLSSLQNVGLENNHFTGSIPPSILQISNLPYLFMQNNDLSGTVPDLSGLINLQGLSLANNSIVLPQLPAWMASLQNLHEMYLANCSIAGEFPSALVFGMQSLTKAKFEGNKFNGTLDLNGANRNLTYLFLENNRITDLKGIVPNNLQLFLGGNPVCDSKSFPLPNLCEMELGDGPKNWLRRPSCPNMNRECDRERVTSPITCNCTYPMVTTIQLSETPFNSLTAPRIGAIERELASSLQLDLRQVEMTNASFTSKATLTAIITCFPPASGVWQHSKLVTMVERFKKQPLLTGDGVYKLMSLKWPQGNIQRDSVNVRRTLSITLPIVAGAVLCLCGALWWRRHETRKRTLKYGVQKELAKHSLQPTFFHFQELKQATRDFDASNKLGEGGFGQVYKGTLPDGTVIAVKRLFPARIQQGTEDFVNEVSIITAVLHRNLVKLIGCCIEETERILIYEFVEHNSLSHALFDKAVPVLSWTRRLEIAVGTARGLAYLHEDCETRIIHRDIKASNILLDKGMNPKISDFGLARLFPDGISHVSTRVAGTFGYVAPEYGLYGQLTEKADTFSFGIVLLELVTGRKSITFREETVLLLEWVWKLFLEGRTLELADSSLEQDLNAIEFQRLVRVGLLCTQASPARRPRMSHVVTMLLGERDVEEVTTAPGIISEILGNHGKPTSRSGTRMGSSSLRQCSGFEIVNSDT